MCMGNARDSASVTCESPGRPVSTTADESLAVKVPSSRSHPEKMVPKFVSRSGPVRVW